MKRISVRMPAAAIVLALSVFSGLSCKPAEAPKSESRMGDAAVAGPLTYNVVEAKWRSQLETSPTPRIPDRHFLLLHVTITNSGGADATVPFLKLENSSGETFTESESGVGVDGWLGLLRRIAPAQTEEGWILFDVPTNSYKLRVTDGNTEREQIAYISIPLNMQTEGDPERLH